MPTDTDEQSYRRTFDNEFGRQITVDVTLMYAGQPPRIKVLVAGPSSLHENVVTAIEAQHLHAGLAAALSLPTAAVAYAECAKIAADAAARARKRAAELDCSARDGQLDKAEEAANIEAEIVERARRKASDVSESAISPEAERHTSSHEHMVSAQTCAAGSIPDGWQLVPKEPMPEMVAAWWRQKNTGTQEIGERGPDTDDYSAYRAMLSASPSPPTLDVGKENRLTLDSDRQVFFYEQDFYVLSNFSAFTLEWNGWRFDTSEAAYHWEKFAHMNEVGFRGPTQHECDICYNIRRATSAHNAFKMAEVNKSARRPDWDAVKVGIMLDILRAKAAQHEYVRRKLLSTGHRELIENSWRDDFWGWGPHRDGQNMLGKLWMQVRAELRDHHSHKRR